MLTSLAYVLLLGMALGTMASRLRLPSLVGMLLAGILLGPCVLNLLSPSLLGISADLRQLALVIILTRAGLSLEPEALRRNAAGLLSELCPQAEAAGVRLLLAPVMGPETPLIAESPVLGRLEELSELLRRVDSPALGVCLDTNVMSTWGDSIPRWFERLGEHTGLVRLCDGNYHGWRAWGEGVLPMERYRAELEAAGYAGPVSLLLPGERYAGRPSWPEERALEVLRGGAE